VLGSFTLAGAMGTLLGGWLGDWRGRLAPIRTGYLIGVPALIGVVLAPNLPVLAASVVVAGAAMFLPFAVQVTLAQDYLPQRPGTASGLTLGLAISVGGLSAPLFGWCADAYGLRFALGVVTVVYLGAVATALRLPDRVRGTDGSPGTTGADGGQGDARGEAGGGRRDPVAAPLRRPGPEPRRPAEVPGSAVAQAGPNNGA
jgi:FSR family fosmidomycin resistance protein-like MFS transporter